MTKLPGVRGCVVVPCETIGGPEPVAVVLFSGSDYELKRTCRVKQTAGWQSISTFDEH